MAVTPNYTSGRFALEVDGGAVGALRRFSGFAMESDVAAAASGPDGAQRKNTVNFRWGTASFGTGVSMGRSMYTWVKASMQRGVLPKDGKFTVGDFNHKALSVFTFSEAVLTEFSVPRLDASSKDAGTFNIGFAPSRVAWAKGDGHDMRSGPVQSPKNWLCSSFKVEIGKLPCARVAAVEAFSWTCGVAARTGGAAVGQRAVAVNVPNLRLAISAADQALWAEAARQWFIEGRRAEADEMSGRITFLGANMVDVLGWVDLRNVGFQRFAPAAFDTVGGDAPRFEVELYVETMGLVLSEYEP